MAPDARRVEVARPVAPSVLRLMTLALVTCALAVAATAAPAPRAASSVTPPPAKPRVKPPAKSPATPPNATLGPYAAALEGTWEFRSMSIPHGPTLAPPAASGVIVIDKGIVLAASYVQATGTRKIGNLWEGRMILTADHYDIVPEKGFHYDSESKPLVTASVPPASKGVLEKTADGLTMRRPDGATVTFESGGRRVQRDRDGTVIVHERTSLVPRIPDDLPGRTP